MKSWHHSDSVLPVRAAVALKRAELMQWGNTTPLPTRVADLRALIAAALYTAASLCTQQAAAPAGELRFPDFSIASYRAPWGKQAAETLLAPLYVLANLGTATTIPERFRTVEGSAPQPEPSDAAGLPLVWVLYIAGAAAWTAVSCYVAHEAADVIDKHLARETDLQGMTAAWAAGIQAVEAHNAREALGGGAPLPLNDAEAAILSNLSQVTTTIAAKQPQTNGSGGFFAGLGLGGIALAAAAFFLFARGK